MRKHHRRLTPNQKKSVEAVPEEQTEDNRPEWLPEKFKSPEDMASAYSELEKKMGAGVEQEEEEESEVQEETDDTQEEDLDSNNIVVEASKEFFQNDGKLSEETYENLAKAGISKEIVDSYAAGQQALMQSEEGSIKSVADGNWDQMAEWASNNLSPEEVNTFDEIVQNGTVEQAKLATKGLYAQFKAENGVSPNLYKEQLTSHLLCPFVPCRN